MSRSERYIPPTPEQLLELQQAELMRVRLADQRRSLTEKALRRMRKETLVQLLMDWSENDIAVRWRIEAALEDHNSPQRARWAAQMQRADSVGCVCWKKLQEWSSCPQQ
jgi:hypothetical protein